jgi:flagellar M-ring protein FliF
MKVLFSNLEQADAAKIVENLKEKAIMYELKDNGSTILVPENTVMDTRLSLASEGLPENSVVGYELFDKTNLGMSEFVQKLNYRRALEGELAKTIASLEEVKKARVHLVIPEKTLFKADQKTPTSSVTLHMKSGRSISKISIQGIQNLISGSVEGMKTEDVVVLDSKGKILSDAAIDENSVAGLTATQLTQQNRVEEHLTGKVQSLLDGVLGAGNSQVRVSAELDFTRIEQTKTDYDPEKQVTRSEQNIVDRNQTADSLSYPYVNMNKDMTNSITNYELSKNVEHIIHEVGAVKRLSVAVMINGVNKVIDNEGIKTLEYTPRADEEMNKFNQIVKNAVGFDPSRNDQISVINIPFDNSDMEGELEEFYSQKWYEKPENQKIIFLLAAILITMILMFALLQSKYIKNRVRVALSLPENIEVEDDEILEEENEYTDEEIVFDENDVLLLPSDLPDQLLLEGDKEDRDLAEAAELDGGEGFDKAALAKRANATFEDTTEVTEQTLIKLEMKKKVEEFVNNNTGEAVRILRMFMMQDVDIVGFKF